MKTEAEVYSLVQRVYADPTAIACVRPLYGGWYNALKYEVVRTDGTVAAIEREDVEAANDEAIADALMSFAPRAGARSCSHCGKSMHEHARYCSGCGKRIAPATEAASFQKGAVGARRRRSGVTTAAVMMTALTCAAGGVAYWVASTTPSFESVRTSASVPTEAPTANPLPSSLDSTPNIVADTGATTPSRSISDETRLQRGSEFNAQTAVSPPAPEVRAPRLSSASKTTARRSAHSSSTRTAKGPAGRAKAASDARPIDVAYQQLSGTQCRAGPAGFLCREKLRFRLCKELWTPNDVPGMRVCRVAAYPGPLS